MSNPMRTTTGETGLEATMAAPLRRTADLERSVGRIGRRIETDGGGRARWLTEDPHFAEALANAILSPADVEQDDPGDPVPAFFSRGTPQPPRPEFLPEARWETHSPQRPSARRRAGIAVAVLVAAVAGVGGAVATMHSLGIETTADAGGPVGSAPSGSAAAPARLTIAARPSEAEATRIPPAAEPAAPEARTGGDTGATEGRTAFAVGVAALAPAALPATRDMPLAGAEPPPAPPQAEVRTPAPRPSVIPEAEIPAQRARAEKLLRIGQVTSARSILLVLSEQGDPQSSHLYAGTFDPEVLRDLKAVGVKPDPEMARKYYRIAADGGVAEAKRRLAQP